MPSQKREKRSKAEPERREIETMTTVSRKPAKKTAKKKSTAKRIADAFKKPEGADEPEVTPLPMRSSSRKTEKIYKLRVNPEAGDVRRGEMLSPWQDKVPPTSVFATRNWNTALAIALEDAKAGEVVKAVSLIGFLSVE
jgi:hypothetical protein